MPAAARRPAARSAVETLPWFRHVEGVRAGASMACRFRAVPGARGRATAAEITGPGSCWSGSLAVLGHGKGSYCFGSLRKVTRWRQATLRVEGDLLVMRTGRVRRLTCPATRKPSKSAEQQVLANRA